MSGADDRRVYFDLSTSLRYCGPPHGIVRVERQLALWALAHPAHVAFVFFDRADAAYRRIVGDIRPFLADEAVLDFMTLPRPEPGGTKRPGSALQVPSYALTRSPRYVLLAALERARLTTRHAWLGLVTDRLQRALMSEKYRRPMMRGNGTRRAFVPYDMVAGEIVRFQPEDTLVCAGAPWGWVDIDALGTLKSQRPFRFVLLCHDLIPLLYPNFQFPLGTELLETFVPKAFTIADRILVNSRRTQADCRSYCVQNGIPAADIVVVPFGHDFQPARSLPHLPPGLEPDRFILLVSGIQHHKGHRLLHRVWLRLLEEGVPQSRGFTLVFVGRPGPGNEQFLAEIAADPRLSGNLLVFTEVDDDLLQAFYAGAAFCVYPSEYEGYGLPVVEALAHGKAVLASDCGAVPELVAGFSPCLSPTDEQAWYSAMKNWMEAPAARAPFEQAIRAGFRHPTWAEAANAFFNSALAEQSGLELAQPGAIGLKREAFGLGQ